MPYVNLVGQTQVDRMREAMDSRAKRMSQPRPQHISDLALVEHCQQVQRRDDLLELAYKKTNEVVVEQCDE